MSSPMAWEGRVSRPRSVGTWWRRTLARAAGERSGSTRGPSSSKRVTGAPSPGALRTCLSTAPSRLPRPRTTARRATQVSRSFRSPQRRSLRTRARRTSRAGGETDCKVGRVRSEEVRELRVLRTRRVLVGGVLRHHEHDRRRPRGRRGLGRRGRRGRRRGMVGRARRRRRRGGRAGIGNLDAGGAVTRARRARSASPWTRSRSWLRAPSGHRRPGVRSRLAASRRFGRSVGRSARVGRRACRKAWRRRRSSSPRAGRPDPARRRSLGAATRRLVGRRRGVRRRRRVGRRGTPARLAGVLGGGLGRGVGGR